MTKKNRKHSAGIVLRDILLALLLVAVVAASAILVYRRFFESGPATPDGSRTLPRITMTPIRFMRRMACCAMQKAHI